MKQLQENSTHCASVHRNMHMHEGVSSTNFLCLDCLTSILSQKSTTLRWSSQAAVRFCGANILVQVTLHP